MRRLATLLVAFMIALPVQAQSRDTSGMVLVPASTLTDQQRQTVQVQNAREWVGLGKEVGEAINSSLAAVTEQTSRFADTKVGRLTMALVIWRVMGNDVVGYLWAFLLFVTIFPVIIWSMRKYMNVRVVTKEYVDANGKVTSRDWGTQKGDEGIALAHYMFILLLVTICSLIAFA